MPANFQIVLKSGPTPGKAFLLDKNELFIGRDLGNDIVINDPEVSRRHARLYLQNNYYVIEDMGSTNGSSVNGQRLTAPYLLRPGEIITFGERVNIQFVAAPQPDLPVAEAVQTPAYPAASVQPGYFTSAQPVGSPPSRLPVYPPPPPQSSQASGFPPPAAQPSQAPVYPSQAAQPSYTPQPIQAQYDPIAGYQPPPQGNPYDEAPVSPFAGQIPAQPLLEAEIRYRIPIWIFVLLGVMAVII
jgi:predicted component of type VI protein secretion system